MRFRPEFNFGVEGDGCVAIVCMYCVPCITVDINFVVLCITEVLHGF